MTVFNKLDFSANKTSLKSYKHYISILQFIDKHNFLIKAKETLLLIFIAV